MWFRKSPELKSSLANKLVLLFLFASIYPFSLITFMGYSAMGDVVRKDTVDELRTFALAGESALVAHLSDRKRALVEAASDLRRRRTAAGEFSEPLELWKARLEAKELVVLGAGGAASPEPSSLDNPDFLSVRAEIKPEVDSLEVMASLGDGVRLMARWPLAELGSLWSGLVGPKGEVSVSLVGPEGRVVSISAAGLPPGRTFPQEVLRRLREGTLGDLAYQSQQGPLVLGVAAGGEIGPILGAPWIVVAEEDAALAFRPVELLRYSMMRFGLVMLILFTLIAVLFAHTIMKPINQLTEGARVIGRGKLDHRLAVETGDEIELLAREFNSMAAELEESYASLEDKIARATAELREHMGKLAEERDKIDGILRSVTDGIIVMDPDRRLLLANPAAEALFGFQIEEAAGQPIEAAVADVTVRAAMGRFLDGEQAEASEEVEFTPAGAESPRVYLAHRAAVLGRKGEALGVVTLFSDVTPFHELDRMKSEFLTVASHELRTPLTSIRGFSEILMVKKLKEGEQEKYLGYINSQAERLGSIISDFLDVARIEAGRGLELVLEPVALEPLVRGSVEIFQSRDLPHSFVAEMEESLPLVEADRAKMEQVFQNLLGNAVKYSPHGGTVRVSASARQGAVLLEVTDQGVGMRPEQVVRVFDKFYRADTSSGEVEGTGLGMFIVKHLVEAHGGSIWVESEVGSGTRVFIILPCPEAAGPSAPERALGEPSPWRAA
jgi:PAS domain S-box-containing protein